MAKKDFVGIYKPNRNSNGSVMQVKMHNNRRECMFLELAKQVRPITEANPYDWENTKVVIKLGDADIGKLLALFNGNWPLSPDRNTPDLDIFHQNDRGNKSIKIKKQDRGYYFKVSAKENGELNSIAIPISWDEAELIKIALTRGYEMMLGW